MSRSRRAASEFLSRWGCMFICAGITYSCFPVRGAALSVALLLRGRRRCRACFRLGGKTFGKCRQRAKAFPSNRVILLVSSGNTCTGIGYMKC
eukprot:8238227-Pyramimonas_sp.AAC.1